MAYRVDISPSALADAEEAYLWLNEQAPSYAAGWYNGLLDAIFSLETSPARCPVAPESEEIGLEIRQLLYGKRGGTYRILFSMLRAERTGEDVVRIYRIWPGARDRVTTEALETDEDELGEI